MENWPKTTNSIPPNSSPKSFDLVKEEFMELESGSMHNPLFDLVKQEFVVVELSLKNQI